MKPRLLVTDGQERSSLAVVRSVGRAGYPVYVSSSAPHCLAGASRYARDQAGAGDPLGRQEAYVDAVETLVRRWDIDLVVPVTDASLLALFGKEEHLRPARLIAPEEEGYRRISDKARVAEMARQIGISVPRQIELSSVHELGRRELDSLGYPIVIKPTRSVVGSGDERKVGASSARKVGVSYAGERPELERELKRLPEEAFPVLLQERIQGPGVGVFMLRWDGEILARFSHRRIREKPPSGGASVYRTAVPPDSELMDRSRRLLAAHDWLGVAMVEYKLDERTGTPYLMEVNGRFWGSLQLAVDAGVDFPRLLVQAYLGEDVEPVLEYRHGVRSRWWWGDIDHLLARLTATREELALPDDAPGRMAALLAFLLLWRPGDRSEVFRWRDPAPFLVETRAWFASAMTRHDA